MDVLIANSDDFNHFMAWTLDFLRGVRSPDLIYPPWVLAPMIPFALLPVELARLLFLVIAMMFYGLIAKRLGASPVAMAAFMLSPLVFNSLSWGNAEWLALSGFLMPPALGLVMFAIKPQLTAAIVVFLLVKVFRDSGLRKTLYLLLPLGFCVFASLLLFGNWPLRMLTLAHTQNQTMNLSFFPASVPVGLFLVSKAVQSKEIRLAVAASPMFSTWVTPQTWLVLPLAMVGSVPRSLFVLIASWITVFIVHYTL